MKTLDLLYEACLHNNETLIKNGQKPAVIERMERDCVPCILFSSPPEFGGIVVLEMAIIPDNPEVLLINGYLPFASNSETDEIVQMYHKHLMTSSNLFYGRVFPDGSGRMSYRLNQILPADGGGLRAVLNVSIGVALADISVLVDFVIRIRRKASTHNISATFH